MSIVSTEVTGVIAIVRLNSPPVNALAQPLRQALLTELQHLRSDDAIKAVVIIGTGGNFIAGADIRELDHTPSQPSLPTLTQEIENFPKPIIAALNGNTLGGGLEISLASHGRIASPKAKLGFPEVNLGIIPGAGGTVRVSRLVEFSDACSLVADGKPISAAKALKIGLIDQVSDDCEKAAIILAQNLIAEGFIPTMQRDIRVVATDQEWQLAIEKNAQVHAPAAGEAIQSLQQGCLLPLEKALAQERERFLRLKETTQSRALRYLFFAERQAGCEIEDTEITISTLGIVGGGTMGCGLAVSALLAGFQVILIDSNTDQCARANTAIASMVGDAEGRGLLSGRSAADVLEKLTISHTLSTITDAEMVIEAVVEDITVKLALLPKIEAHLSNKAYLCSNTSYLDLNQLYTGLQNPARFLGLHFFAPAHRNKLVEIVATHHTHPEALKVAKKIAKKMRKIPVFSRACTGYIGNRILSRYRKECDFLLEEGALPREIDQAMSRFGYVMGNYQVADMSGLDIAWAMRKNLAATNNTNERYSHIADQLCEKGWFGRKTGRGWYDYREDPKGRDCPEVAEIIYAQSKALGHERQDFSEAEIMARLLAAMHQEAQSVLHEGVAAKETDIDLVMVTGLGFPRTKGGPVFYQRMGGD